MSNFTRAQRVAVGDGTTSGTSVPGIKKGDLLLLDEQYNVVSTNAAAAALPKYSKVHIALGTADGKARFITIEGDKTSKYVGQDAVAKSEQVTYLGYDGTNGAGIESEADTDYRLRVLIKDDNRIGHRSTFIDTHYKTGSDTTAYELASKIACLFDATDYDHNYAKNFVKLERVSNGSRTAFAADADVVEGSKSVSIAGHGLSIDDVVKFEGISYLVAAIPDANTITLDQKYKGETATITTANTDSGSYGSVTVWGFKLTGLEIDSKVSRAANSPLDLYQWVNFDAGFSVAQDTSADAYSAEIFTTSANPGQGYWKQVAQAEEMSKPNYGDQSKRLYYDQRLENNTVVGTSYGSVIIEHSTEIGSFALESARGIQVAEIYLPTGSDQATNSANNFLHVLNGFFSGSVGFEAISTL